MSAERLIAWQDYLYQLFCWREHCPTAWQAVILVSLHSPAAAGIPCFWLGSKEVPSPVLQCRAPARFHNSGPFPTTQPSFEKCKIATHRQHSRHPIFSHASIPYNALWGTCRIRGELLFASGLGWRLSDLLAGVEPTDLLIVGSTSKAPSLTCRPAMPVSYGWEGSHWDNRNLTTPQPVVAKSGMGHCIRRGLQH